MTITRRTLMTAAIGLALATTLGATAADAKIASTEEALTPLVMGDPNAKVEVVEYASLSCPHCRSFHDEVFPAIKKDYIDTGKIRFEFVDFPTNSPGLAAAMIARCAGPERQAGMIDLFFDTQPQWGRSDNPLQALTMVSRMAGLGPGDDPHAARLALQSLHLDPDAAPVPAVRVRQAPGGIVHPRRDRLRAPRHRVVDRQAPPPLPVAPAGQFYARLDGRFVLVDADSEMVVSILEPSIGDPGNDLPARPLPDTKPGVALDPAVAITQPPR